MRKELAEGVTVLRGAMRPQLFSIVAYGENMANHFGENMGTTQTVDPGIRSRVEAAISQLSQPPEA